MTKYDATEMAYRNGYEAGCRACEAEIVQLSEKCQRLQKELDAAVADLKQNNKCRICKHKKENIQDCQYYSSCGLAYIHFEWRDIDE